MCPRRVVSELSRPCKDTGCPRIFILFSFAEKSKIAVLWNLLFEHFYYVLCPHSNYTTSTRTTSRAVLVVVLLCKHDFIQIFTSYTFFFLKISSLTFTRTISTKSKKAIEQIGFTKWSFWWVRRTFEIQKILTY